MLTLINGFSVLPFTDMLLSPSGISHPGQSVDFVGILSSPYGALRTIFHAVIRRRIDFAGFFQIKQCATSVIQVAVAACPYPVIDEQPALWRFDRRRAGTDLGGLPARRWPHHKPVASPVDEIRAGSVEDGRWRTAR